MFEAAKAAVSTYKNVNRYQFQLFKAHHALMALHALGCTGLGGGGALGFVFSQRLWS
jgi:hypothetical protein